MLTANPHPDNYFGVVTPEEDPIQSAYTEAADEDFSEEE